jgi:hypothetical protein
VIGALALMLSGCGASSGHQTAVQRDQAAVQRDQAAVQRVIGALRSDVTQHRYAAACALLDPKLSARIASETLGPPNSCATGLAAASTRAPGVFRDLPTGPIQIRGNCGYVPRPCHGTGCAAIAPLTVCGGQRGWRVVGL